MGEDEDVLSPTEMQMKGILRRMLNAYISQAFSTWCSFTAESRRVAILLQRTMRKWRNKALAGCFDGWYAIVCDRRRNRSILSRCAAKIRNRKLNAVFNSWSFTVKEYHRHRILLIALRKLRLRGQLACFNAWVAHGERGGGACLGVQRQVSHARVCKSFPVVGKSCPKRSVCAAFCTGCLR